MCDQRVGDVAQSAVNRLLVGGQHFALLGLGEAHLLAGLSGVEDGQQRGWADVFHARGVREELQQRAALRAEETG